ncbi:MAG: hypothetical protein JWM80_2666 [Cyanobacteria bacterium RYN_339]|nr:hypothetical protein [Cyanobacteria bacterium RYN_339]
MPLDIAALPLPFILAKVVYAATLLSLLLIVFVPFFPGVAVILVAIAGWVGYNSFLAHNLAGMPPVSLGFVVVIGLIALTSAWWTEKLELRFSYASQDVVWGMMIGSFAFGAVLGTMFWFLVGMFAGAVIMEARDGRPLQDAVRRGLADVYSTVGPRGFQLLMAMLIVDAAVPLGSPFPYFRLYGQ